MSDEAVRRQIADLEERLDQVLGDCPEDKDRERLSSARVHLHEALLPLTR